ncbi:glycerophosphodiester phosphodiesterase [Anaeromyxobacter oryzisoli]|uniref:glycerophosphodiester phosphodiesterase n=1 Tax=Anaeromyxobacter oryzisoli TaxID=2925408 RepID=UPI001F598E69|nr:glycerophosphodiester phosphodiesterase [Anaeromyxobacter sp. SG63]
MSPRRHRPYLDLPGPWLVAHRGGSLLAPENTLVAFDRAAALGADAIETDVHLTQDGVVVVFHDDDTARLTGAPGTIEGRTFAEVSALDAGFAFTPDGGRTYPHRGRGLRPPALSDVLARYPGLRFNVDAKSEDPALASALARTVEAAGAVDRVCVGSFSDAQAERLGALLPDCARFLPEKAATCHVLAAKGAGDGAACPEGFDVADLPHRLDDQVVVDAAVVDWFHARGIPVHVWTVDEEADMRALLALGVDGIVTDRPDVLARVLGR